VKNYWLNRTDGEELDQTKQRMKALAVSGLAALAVIAAWQFYFFARFKDASGAVDIRGGTLHLWPAISIAMIVSVDGVFIFSKLLRYDNRNEMHITTAGQQISLAGV
jgi:hypothetical protein